MKVLKIALVVLVLVAAAYPQTKDLGMGAFSNESGAILMAVDASWSTSRSTPRTPCSSSLWPPTTRARR